MYRLRAEAALKCLILFACLFGPLVASGSCEDDLWQGSNDYHFQEQRSEVAQIIATYGDTWDALEREKDSSYSGGARAILRGDLEDRAKKFARLISRNGNEVIAETVQIAISDQEAVTTRLSALSLLERSGPLSASAESSLSQELNQRTSALLLSLTTSESADFPTTIDDPRLFICASMSLHEDPQIQYTVRLYRTLFAISPQPNKWIEDLADVLLEVSQDSLDASDPESDYEAFAIRYNRRLAFVSAAVRAFHSSSAMRAFKALAEALRVNQSHVKSLLAQGLEPRLPVWVHAMIIECVEANQNAEILSSQLYPLASEAFAWLLKHEEKRFYEGEIKAFDASTQIAAVQVLASIHRYEALHQHATSTFTMAQMLQSELDNLVTPYGSWELGKLDLIALVLSAVSEQATPMPVETRLFAVIEGLVGQLSLFSRLPTKDPMATRRLAIQYLNLVAPLVQVNLQHPQRLAEIVHRSLAYIEGPDLREPLEELISLWTDAEFFPESDEE